MVGRRTRFAADAMLGSLARKLRALGFDTAYYKSGDDAGLLRLASESGRIVVTADRELASLARSRGVRAILVTGNGDGQRIRRMAEGARAQGIDLTRGDPLCSVCGGELLSVRKVEIAAIVPPSVVTRHRLFFRCSDCGQLYWRGSHWKRLMSLARNLEQGKHDAPNRRR